MPDEKPDPSADGKKRKGVRRVALKKTDIYQSLWRSCDELRGGMDASQYKNYILTLLFLKYVSDKAQSDEGTDLEIPEGCYFEDIVAHRHKDTIGEKIDRVIAEIAKENDLHGVIDVVSFNDDERLGRGKELIDRVSSLVGIFNDLDFAGTRADGDDLLGDAYEFLMRHFASLSGKVKGEFYTPAEVSRILAKVVGTENCTDPTETLYDPTCGSGSLLLKAADLAPRGISIYGQEKDGSTYGLARMNMILHGQADAVIEKGDVISAPGFTNESELKRFDYIVANPPFSLKSWSNGIISEQDVFNRFELGIPPNKNGDYAFILHILASLKSTGKAAVIMPHGVLFRGGSEGEIRRQLIRRGYIKGIIGLPPNLFYGTGIPACVLVLDKSQADSREHILMIDASNGFRKDGPKNRLRAQDIHKIVDYFNNEIEEERFSRRVPISEISSDDNDYNLNIPRYIDASDPEDIHDLEAHIYGGIPDRDIDALDQFWQALPSLRDQLFEPERAGYNKLKIAPEDLDEVIASSPDMKELQARVQNELEEWWATHRPTLEAIGPREDPHAVIQLMAEDLLQRFRNVPLLDAYDVYERLIQYWDQTMHDDVFLIASEGWAGAARPRKPRQIGTTDKPKYEEPDITVGAGRSARKYKTDLLPPAIIIEQYFTERKEALDEMEANLEAATAAREAFEEDHGFEDGLLGQALNEKGKLTKTAVKERAKAWSDDPAYSEELDAAKTYLDLLDDETAIKSTVKAEATDLAEAIIDTLGKLSDQEAMRLVLEGKWKRDITRSISDLVHEQTARLLDRLVSLNDRYEQTSDVLRQKLTYAATQFEDHLQTLLAARAER